MLFTKYIQKIHINGTVLAFVILSCSKKTETPAPVFNPTFSYTVNGKNYSASNQILLRTQNLAPVGGGYSIASGINIINGVTTYKLAIRSDIASSDTLGFLINLVSPSPIATTSYTILPTIINVFKKEGSTDTTEVAFYKNNLPPNGILAKSGTLTIHNIDKVNKRISGTFNFTASYTNPDTSDSTLVNVTNGLFTDISIQEL